MRDSLPNVCLLQVTSDITGPGKGEAGISMLVHRSMSERMVIPAVLSSTSIDSERPSGPYLRYLIVKTVRSLKIARPIPNSHPQMS